MQTAFGTASNAHGSGSQSGLGKVLREVTIIRTGGGSSSQSKRERMIGRQSQSLNRRKSKIIDLKKKSTTKSKAS